MSMLVEFDEACWHPKALLKMHNLRLLIGSVQSRKLLFFDGLKKVFNATKIVYWTEYPLKTLPLEGSSDKLVEIHMPFCHIKQLWRGVQVTYLMLLIVSSNCCIATVFFFSFKPIFPFIFVLSRFWES